MTRAPILSLRRSAALLALGFAVPLAAQQSPRDFTLPTATPTPTPVPEGPADERAGVAIPPRAVTPSPVPSPTPSPTGSRAPVPAPSATPLALPSPRPSPTAPAPRPVASAVPTPTPTPSPSAEAESEATPPAVAAQPGFPTLAQPEPVLPTPAPAPSEALGAPLFDWRWLAGGGLLLAVLLAGLALWRRRGPKPVRLAAPVESAGPEAELPRIDIALEILGGTRSVMKLTLAWRLTLANRSDRAVNDLAVAVQLTTAQRGQSNAAPLAAAGSLAAIERIGPHQSRSISGEVQMPVAAIVPVMQGRTPLFVPLVHVTLEGEGQQALTRSFVVGTPSTGAEARVQPLPLDLPPGSLPALRARPIAGPEA
ncbi:MAG: hypothetical protein GC147_09835 [Porphyrobacter sp.]|nr:hypothetical protein [Porphyrobacter sp.]